MHRLSNLTLSFLLTSALALPLAACGDDDGGGSDDPDAAPDSDAAPDPDASPDPVALRNGTLAVAETSITNEGLPVPVGGALNLIYFLDETSRTVAPVPGFASPVGGCAIFVYDVGDDEEPDRVDEGTITVTGTSNGSFECHYDANNDAVAGQYTCQSTVATTAGGDEGNAAAATLTGATDSLAIGADVVTDEWVGMYIQLDNFPPITDGTRIPIVAANPTTDTITLGTDINDALVQAGAETSTFTTFVGYKPVPGGNDFLTTDEVTITKEDGDVIPEIDETLTPAGQGTFDLVDDAGMDFYLPHQIPMDAAVDVSFHCDDCGSEGEATGGLYAFTINGVTTDGAIASLIDMPAPETQYATFQCSVLGTEPAAEELQTVTIPEAAMQVILDTNPTRIQTSVGHYAGYRLSSEDLTTYNVNLLVGHNKLGYSTPE
jgi:hypothetical protein